ncbi:Hypothetical protein NocV09_12100030 [Nannochloropsis oceanica]
MGITQEELPKIRGSRLAAKGEAKSLKAFIRRAQVLALYRSFLRCVGCLERPDLQLDIKTQIMDGFRLHRDTEEYNISSLLVEANRHLEQLKSMVPKAGRREGGKAGGTKGGKEKEEERKEYVVGEGWPWQK